MNCLSRHNMDDISALYNFLVEVQKDHGMATEALDAVIAELERGGTIGEATWYACCEWDL